MKTWEDRFDKVLELGQISNKTYGEWFYGDEYNCEDLVKELKAFIASELEKQKEEIVEMIKGMKKINESGTLEELLKAENSWRVALSKAKNIDERIASEYNATELAKMAKLAVIFDYYNQTLDDIIKKIGT